jgi:hypothetical protein
VLPRSLELRVDFQTHRWPYIWEDNENRVISNTLGLHPIGKPRVSPLRFLNISAVIQYLICVYASHFRITSIKLCAPRISSKIATIDECIEFALNNIGLWWRYGISRNCDEWKYIIIGRIFESEIILIPPSLKIS